MSLSLADLNAMSFERAGEVFRACCGASRWIDGMVVRRPFASTSDVLATADDVWARLGPDDWREAFAHHPRIGERRAEVPQADRASEWSVGEQSRVATAPASVQEQLAIVNREYESRFGFIYLVCAAGRTAEDLLATARERLQNDPDTELRVAASEQQKITRLRLEKLFSEAR
jgi:OHCU decarboxylase